MRGGGGVRFSMIELVEPIELTLREKNEWLEAKPNDFRFAAKSVNQSHNSGNRKVKQRWKSLYRELFLPTI